MIRWDFIYTRAKSVDTFLSRLVVKKRYQDFQALHKSMSEIHKGLYLDGDFPELTKSSKGFFKKSPPFDNLEETLRQFQKLLEFCSKFSTLCNSKIFTSFFADLESPATDLESPEPKGALKVDLEPIVNVHELARRGNIFDAAAVSTILVIVNIISQLAEKITFLANLSLRPQIRHLA